MPPVTGFPTDYAKSQSPWAYQCPPGKITRGVEQDGRAYERHECEPGVNWNGMQRADCLEQMATMHHWREGDEIAFAWDQLLEPGFTAANPGWSVVGPEIHDQSSTAQSELELLTSQNGVQVRAFGGNLNAAKTAPADPADKFYSPLFPFSQGVYHRCALGLKFSADRTKGHVRYQLDGKLVVDQTCATIYSGSTGYIKLAYYRDPSQAGNKTNAVRFGNVAVYQGATAWQEATGGTSPPPVDLFAAARAEVEQFRAGSPHIAAAFDETFRALGS